MLFDSHAHIGDLAETEEELRSIIEEIEEHPLLQRVADIGYDLPSSVRVMENAARYPWCTGVVGVHPHDAASMDESIYEEIKRLALSGASAIGEIGLDYYYMRSPREDQIYWFRRQIALANELGMPIVIHSRDADKETMDILTGEPSRTRGRLFSRNGQARTARSFRTPGWISTAFRAARSSRRNT